MTTTDQQLVELWEIAVFLNQQTRETQKLIRELHKKEPRRALYLVRKEMYGDNK